MRSRRNPSDELGQRSAGMDDVRPAPLRQRDGIDWRGVLQPSELSQLYTVQLLYRAGGNPRVFVRRPTLEARAGRKPEHLYPDGSLCLFHPRRGEWLPSDVIAHTIIPWAAEWLFHYECWLFTGEWLGGGEHPKG